MTEPSTPAPDQVDETVDTTDGRRDPLTTDDGLAAAAEQMPQVDDDREVADTSGSASSFGQTVKDAPAPGLEIADDGTDPVADLAVPGDDKEG